jgi:hydrogenase maturation protease
MARVSAIVLAGGKSQRLGVDKTLLRLDGVWLLQYIVEQLRALSDDVLVVANDRQKLAPLGVPVVPDEQAGIGPLAGIYSGLTAMRHDVGLFVACDMPLLNLRLLRYMIRLSTDVDVVIPREGDETEPLHALYGKACLVPIAAALERGERRVIHFFDRVRVRYVDPAEVAAFDPERLSLFNINTTEDLESAARLWARRRRNAARATGGPGRVLVVGYGSLERGDDGVGFDIIQSLRTRLGRVPLSENESGLDRLGAALDTVFLTQLLPQLVDVLVGYDRVIFVDAHVRADVPGLHCAEMQPGASGAASAHHLSPAILLALLERLRRKQIEATSVSVRAYELGFERGLSPRTRAGIEPAVDSILDLAGLSEDTGEDWSS